MSDVGQKAKHSNVNDDDDKQSQMIVSTQKSTYMPLSLQTLQA